MDVRSAPSRLLAILSSSFLSSESLGNEPPNSSPATALMHAFSMMSPIFIGRPHFRGKTSNAIWSSDWIAPSISSENVEVWSAFMKACLFFFQLSPLPNRSPVETDLVASVTTVWILNLDAEEKVTILE